MKFVIIPFQIVLSILQLFLVIFMYSPFVMTMAGLTWILTVFTVGLWWVTR